VAPALASNPDPGVQFGAGWKLTIYRL